MERVPTQQLHIQLPRSKRIRVLLQHLEETLRRVVYGQDEAIKALTASIKLARAGLVRAERGQSGGFSLARSATTISLLDIYRAVMPDTELMPLHENPENSKCPVSCNVRIALSAHLDRAQSIYERELQKVMLADIEKTM